VAPAGGGSGDAMLRSLNGHVAANLDNGAVEVWICG
jgi:uncharacterized protein involved in outer membrane biogenesis